MAKANERVTWALVNSLATLRADRDAIDAEMRTVEAALAKKHGVKIPQPA